MSPRAPTTSGRAIPKNCVGMPAALALEEFGSQVWHAFGHGCPFLVGSAVRTRRWRDIDVRLIIDDAAYKALGLGDPTNPAANGKWTAFCRAFSALGREMTGLPIDFQIQQRTRANATYGREHARIPIGLVELRLERPRRRRGR